MLPPGVSSYISYFLLLSYIGKEGCVRETHQGFPARSINPAAAVEAIKKDPHLR